MAGPSVSCIQERAQKNGMSKTNAKRVHHKEGFHQYSGPKLRGPRFVLPYNSKDYPQALRTIPRPPEKLYLIGNPDALQEGLAIVGARKATPYGLESAERFGRIAARKGIVIISGGARGCDSAAHRAALKEGSKTVVFLGGGCDQIYPAQNFGLFQDIVNAGGAIVSEQDWDYPCLRHLFRERNRLIAGLAKATLIVEAGFPSGTFITADEALNASKDVLVVPGAITSANSRGANRLLYQGATPIVDDETFEDVISSIYGPLPSAIAPSSNSLMPCGPEDEDQLGDSLLAAVSARPTSLEELCSLSRSFQGDCPNILARCAQKMKEYEGMGLVVRLSDGRYSARVLQRC